MSISLGDLSHVAKRLQMAAYDTATGNYPGDGKPLTMGESSVVGYLIYQSEPKSIRNIVEATGLVQSWVSTSVRNLSERGWVTLGQDPNDKRVTTVMASDELLAESKKTVAIDANAVLKNTFPNATEDQLKTIYRGIETFAKLMQDKK